MMKKVITKNQVQKKPQLVKQVNGQAPIQTLAKKSLMVQPNQNQMQRQIVKDQVLNFQNPTMVHPVHSLNKLGNFYNDEEIKEQQEFVKTTANKSYDLMKSVQLSVTSIQKAVKLSSTNTQQIPVQVSLKTDDSVQESVKDNTTLQQDSRPPLDLVCVIDKSGSMDGQKLQLVKDTLIYLLDLLNEKDRLCLITFESSAQGILPLTCVSEKNIPTIRGTINGIYSTGGTNINSGMGMAFQALKRRRFRNQVSSVFLLSDGLDGQAQTQVPITLNQMKIEENFTINSFGYGGDHDPVMMNAISQLKDGSFYYVQKLDTVDEMFVDALGGLFSVVAQNVNIKVQVKKDNKIFADVNIVETYGDFWKYDEKSNIYNINLQQLISGISKDFLLELEIPPIQKNLMDNERNTVLLEAEVSLQGLDEKKETYVKTAQLELTFYNENDEIPEDINENVEMNVLRVRGAKALQKAVQEADRGNYEIGQKFISDIQMQIEKAQPKTKAKLSGLISDLEENKISCNKVNYISYGKKAMISNNRAHMEQRSKGLDFENDIYMNSVQQCMNKKTKAKKMMI